jgi:hypothetical protein
MTQKTKKKEEPLKAKDKMAELRNKFDTIKKQATFRKVRLLYSSCCGCGCYDVTIERTVEADSSLKDGDRATDFVEGDKIIDDDDD